MATAICCLFSHINGDNANLARYDANLLSPSDSSISGLEPGGQRGRVPVTDHDGLGKTGLCVLRAFGVQALLTMAPAMVRRACLWIPRTRARATMLRRMTFNCGSIRRTT